MECCDAEGTPFYGGKFRMKLVLSEDYPSSPPRGYFLTKIYHPNIASNGDICVNTLKRDWTPEVTFKHILQVIRCLLIVPFPESALNDEAGKLFMESYEEFARRARIMTEVHALRDDDARKKAAGEDDTSGDLPQEALTGTPTDAVVEKITSQKRKTKDAKKKAMKRL